MQQTDRRESGLLDGIPGDLDLSAVSEDEIVQSRFVRRVAE
jgi:hypothetical protein